jgi:hypothetical protein
MSELAQDPRHLSLATLDALWDNAAPMVLPIQGTPPCRLQLDPKNRQMSLLVPYATPEPDVAKLKNVRFSALASGDEELAELTVVVDGEVHAAYGLLATIADQLQLHGMPLAAAVAAAVTRHRNVLASRGSMTTEQEVGLLGELLFLEFLIRQVGPGAATSAWQGPFSEEHDFTFDYQHIEVKTTSTERRKHVIHGLDQLVPLKDVPLSVLSVQLTRSSPLGGRSLPQVIADVRRSAGGHQVAIDAMLNSSNWQDEDADLYTSFWSLRSTPRAYNVTQHFPAMTPDKVATVVPNFTLVTDVTYKIDLTDLAPDSLPEPLAGFTETKDS